VEGLVGALATVHAGPMGLLVPDDLTVEFVSQEVNGGIEVAVAGLAMDIFSRKVNRHLRSLIEFLNAQDNMDLIDMVESVDFERFPILCNRAPRNLNPLGPETICNLLI